MDDRDYSSTLLLVEDNQNDVESTLATLSKGRPIEEVFIARDGEETLDSLLRRAAYRSQAAENPKAGFPARTTSRPDLRSVNFEGLARTRRARPR